jgi:hypothetical protein
MVVIFDASQIGKMPPVSMSLLISAAAAPILITAAHVRKFDIKINRLKSTHHKLQKRYQIIVLKRTVCEIKPLDRQ